MWMRSRLGCNRQQEYGPLLVIHHQPPEFDSPHDPDEYTFTIGYGSTKGIWVGRALAIDPDANDAKMTGMRGRKSSPIPWGKDKKKDNWVLPDDGGTVASWHSYVVKNVTAAGAELYNPWGDRHITISWNLLKGFIQLVDV
ncbi:MAG: hypothetical protein NZO58_14820 [Gemmataceae bacterium]|nr:hypothetical protein [Gemmataceae bacterium]